ncbi:uncharacterized protein BO80DRAFT_427147 [Aspergillus ibericus CBS 121593]|uniref:Uncharacterized protein n=1 Tax=Aspergillus ibericus CBS 121593 TaxID=1448316 RepID=A0A395GUY8_9EURO|nr:hypothetical protein BO80DRAFT_427147 [Aspergillus ibericus CBS 121593]RAK98828.1 hypothetical protein BO80DRAFT_427147 [Aspergillus ibericus CBS 121593]
MPDPTTRRFSLRSFFHSKKDRRPTSIATTSDYLYEKIPDHHHHHLPELESPSQPSPTSPRDPPTPTTPPPPTQPTAFLWQDIDSPADSDPDYPHYLNDDITPPIYPTTTTTTTTKTTKTPEKTPDLPPDLQTMITTTKQALHAQLTNPDTPITSLPGYNDVSGAVVVDWDGLPHFLSPQEEEDRKMKLQRAVKEKMLGLPRRTDFEWERPGQEQGGDVGGTVGRSVSLPKYSPVKGKAEGLAMGRVGGRSSVR